MSRDLVQQKGLESAGGKLAQMVDVDAEHDPKVSRQASNAALSREAVQMRGGAAGKEPAHVAAERGVQSPSQALPHADAIQRSFGAHDISHVKAHVGDESARAMGAEAYATGNHVVFDKQPDLHTAAHEAAHVVQQRGGVQLKGGVGAAGDAYERNADEVADRVVQGKSAEDLLGTPGSASAQDGAVQKKEAPTQAYADQSLIHAIQSHVKLMAARMHAGGAKIQDILKSPNYAEAGDGPAMQMIEATISAVHGGLDDLYDDIMRVPGVVRGTLTDEFGALTGAWFYSWQPALSKVYTYTHDQDGKPNNSALSIDASIGTSREKTRRIFRLVGLDEGDLRAPAPRRMDPATVVEERDEELQAAELEALKDSMYSVEVALDLINADLHSSVSDQSKEVRDLTMSVRTLVHVLEPISPEHIGKITKLPPLLQKLDTLHDAVVKMKDAGEDKGKALASLLENPTYKNDQRRLWAKIASIKSFQKESKKHKR